jgi:hypothetical protein
LRRRSIVNHLDLISFWAFDIISRFLVITNLHLLQPAPNPDSERTEKKEKKGNQTPQISHDNLRPSGSPGWHETKTNRRLTPCVASDRSETTLLGCFGALLRGDV